jgi:hypothetical protein
MAKKIRHACINPAWRLERATTRADGSTDWFWLEVTSRSVDEILDALKTYRNHAAVRHATYRAVPTCEEHGDRFRCPIATIDTDGNRI